MENQNIRQWTEAPKMSGAAPQAAVPQAMEAPILRDARTFHIVYPEIYYKVQPYVIMMCDEMDVYGPVMPSQETLDQMADCIYDDCCRANPDLAEYAREMEKNDQAVPAVNSFGNPDGFGFRRRPRRRGFFRDFISVLLLSELFRRRRRFW